MKEIQSEKDLKPGDRIKVSVHGSGFLTHLSFVRHDPATGQLHFNEERERGAVHVVTTLKILQNGLRIGYLQLVDPSKQGTYWDYPL